MAKRTARKTAKAIAPIVKRIERAGAGALEVFFHELAKKHNYPRHRATPARIEKITF